MAEPPRIYLDSNVFIHAFEGEGLIATRCRSLLASSMRGSLKGFTSELTLAEVLLERVRTRHRDLKRAYLAVLGGRRSVVEIMPVTRAVLTESVEYRARFHPDKPGPTDTKRNFLLDAIHVVTAMAAEAVFYVSTDRRIQIPRDMVFIDPRAETFGHLSEIG